MLLINPTITMTSLLIVVNNNSHKLSEFVHLNMLKRPLHHRPRRRKKQVSLSSSLSIRHSEKGKRFASCSLCHSFIWQHHSPDITRHAKGSAHLAYADSSKTTPKIASLFLDSLRYLNLSFSNWNLFFIRWWCYGSLKFVLSEKASPVLFNRALP